MKNTRYNRGASDGEESTYNVVSESNSAASSYSCPRSSARECVSWSWAVQRIRFRTAWREYAGAMREGM